MAQYEVTGTLSPDVTGVYSEAGTINGQPYYSRDAGGPWYISYSVALGAQWVISDTPGASNGWVRGTGNPVDGNYSPLLGKTGTATVSLHVISGRIKAQLIIPAVFHANGDVDVKPFSPDTILRFGIEMDQ